MVKSLGITIVAFFVGVVTSALMLSNYAGIDLLSEYHEESYYLNKPIKISDSKNGKVFNLPEGLIINRNKSYDTSNEVSVDFIIDILELEKLATKQEQKYPNRYWHGDKTK